MKGLDFLKQKYNLNNSPEVESAVERANLNVNKPNVPNNASDRIETYLNRFKEIIDRSNPEKRTRGIQALGQILHDKFIIKPEQVPQSAFLLEQRIARDLGHGHVEITEEFRKRKIEQIINNQMQSLDKWIEYLSSPNAQYPDWAKYWAFRSMLEMGKLEKKEDDVGNETAYLKREIQEQWPPFLCSIPEP